MDLPPHPPASAKGLCVLLAFVLSLQGIAFNQTEQPSAVNQALLDAAYDLNAEKVKQALADGADPNATDKYGGQKV